MAQSNVRDKLVEAGLEVIHSQGFNDCSVQDITEAAGVPKGSFYNYFESKEALAVEVLGAYRGHCDLERLQDRTVPPLDRLRDYFLGSVRMFKDAGFRRGCLMGNLGAELSDSSELVRGALAQRFDQWHQALAAVVREGQVLGDINDVVDSDQMARYLVSSWEGALLQMKITRSSQPLDDFFEYAFVPLQPGKRRHAG
jgi:TetR/AcrR family transcriptional repressor of nem operon